MAMVKTIPYWKPAAAVLRPPTNVLELLITGSENSFVPAEQYKYRVVMHVCIGAGDWKQTTAIANACRPGVNSRNV